MDPNVRRKRQYFRDMMPVMSSLAEVMRAYNPRSDWLPHVAAVIEHDQVITLNATGVPNLLPPPGVLRSNDPTVNGRFAPASSTAARPTNDVISPRRQNNLQHTTGAPSGSALAVTFEIDESHSSVSGITTAPGPLIVYDATLPSSTAENYDSCEDIDLFASSSDE